MKYKLLPRDEWDKLRPAFEQLKQDIPEWSQIAVAMDDDDKIVAMQVLQPQFHAEPLWIDSNYRGQVNFMRLQEPLKQLFPKGMPYWIFTRTERVGKMAEISGLERMPYTVYRGKV